mgnify:CR=1 FL=1
MTLTLHFDDMRDCNDFEVSPLEVNHRGSVMIRVRNNSILDYETRTNLTLIVSILI